MAGYTYLSVRFTVPYMAAHGSQGGFGGRRASFFNVTHDFIYI